MIKLSIITFLLFSSFCFAQKEYEFDYLIEYEVMLYKDSIRIKNRPFREKNKTLKKYYLTNSKKNNFSVVITELDSLNYKMIFKDENGILFDVKFLKSSLNSAEYINIDCKYVSRYRNPYKYQTDNYDFSLLEDTIINGNNYKRYKLESTKPKLIRRKKIGTNYYIIDNNTEFHAPLLHFSTAYEEWKTNRTLPNGIFKEKYFIDFYGLLDSKETLIKYSKIDKKILIKKECDFTSEK